MYARLKREPLRTTLSILDHYRVEPRPRSTAFPSTYDAVPTTNDDPLIDTLDAELGWSVATLRTFQPDIQAFITLKLAFEKQLLLGDHGTAATLLTDLRTRFGLSLWLLEAEMMLAEQTGGLVANRTLLESVLSRKPPWHVDIFCNFSSQRVEAQNSYSGFDKALEQFFAAYANDDVAPALAHIRFRAHFSTFRTTAELPFALFRERLAPVVDQYLTTVRTLQYLAISDRRQLARTATRLAVHLLADSFPDDPALVALRHLIQPGRPLAPTEVNTLAMDLIDSYSDGDYSRVMEGAGQAIHASPQVLELYELYSLATHHARVDFHNPLPPNSIAAHLLQNLHTFLARSHDSSTACERLRHFGIRLDSFTLGQSILALVDSNFAPLAPHPEQRTHLFSRLLTPRFSTLYESAADSRAFLDALDVAHPSSSTVAIFRTVYGTAGDVPSTVPELRRNTYLAKAAMQVGHYPEAAARLRALLPETERIPPARARLVRDLFYCYLSSSHLDACADLVVDTYLFEPSYLWQLPLASLFARIEEDTEQAPSGNISRPILGSILFGASTNTFDLRRVFVAYDWFLSALGLERPTQLPPLAHSLSPTRLTYFLRYVCAPYILDSAFLVFESTNAVEAERIGVCQWLLTNDASHADIYAAEISKLTRDAALRRAQRHVDQSKIHVDVSGLKRSLEGSFFERIARYIAYCRLSTTTRTAVVLERVTNKYDLILVVTDAAFSQFCTLVAEIRDRFVSSNAYGLDSYLSIRIRHGTLSGQLRSQFQRESLITTRNAKGVYGVNEVWTPTVFQPRGLSAKANEYLAAFSHQVDGLIETLRDSWIQIKGPSKPSGLFDFAFSGAQLGEMFADLQHALDPATFVDAIIAQLMRRTEANVKAIRAKLESELAAELLRAVDEMSTRIFGLDPALAHSTFADAVARCRTNVSNAVATIAAWFDTAAKDKPPDFSLQLACETAVAQVQNCFPHVTFAPTIDATISRLCPGRIFVGLSDLLFIPLENILRHSDLSDPKASISMACTNGDVRIRIGNNMRPSVREHAVAAAAVINAFTPDSALDSVKHESRSGYPKLHKLLRYDLDCGDEYQVRASVDGDSFCVDVTIPTGRLFEEGQT